MKFLILTLISSFAFAANEKTGGTLPVAVENQCRLEAKEIALKSYQSCVSTKKAEQLNLLRKEYQVRMNDLKNEYDQKIKSLVSKPDTSSTSVTEPTVTLKKVKINSKKKSKKSLTSPDNAIISETELIESQNTRVESNEVTGDVEKLEMEDTSLTTY